MRENLLIFFFFFSSKFLFLFDAFEFFDFFSLEFFYARNPKLSCVCLFLCALLRILNLSLLSIHTERKKIHEFSSRGGEGKDEDKERE